MATTSTTQRNNISSLAQFAERLILKICPAISAVSNGIFFQLSGKSSKNPDKPPWHISC
jgi:hypothetical protein